MRPGTRNRAREAYFAVRRFGAHLTRHWRHGGELAAHCAGKADLLLNIGCGELIRADWINADYVPRQGVFYCDALDPLPLAGETVRHIHCEHFLEHLEFADAVRLLGECYRVLQAGGSMRIIVPDAERYMRAYCAGDREFFDGLADLGCPSEPFVSPAAVCNQSFRMGGGHRFAWDFETLEAVSRRLGFRDISRSGFNAIEPQFQIDGDEDWRRRESLYVNIMKA